MVPYPELHPYNGGFNLASGLLFISCNTQLDKNTFSDVQIQKVKRKCHQIDDIKIFKRKCMDFIFRFDWLIHIISKMIGFIFHLTWTEQMSVSYISYISYVSYVSYGYLFITDISLAEESLLVVSQRQGKNINTYKVIFIPGLHHTHQLDVLNK